MTRLTLDILMVTWNRLDYTRRALPALLDSCEDGMRVWLWQNGNHDETRAYVESMRDHPRFHAYRHSPENVGLAGASSWFWGESDADLFSRVDDDCLVERGWAHDLVAAHEAKEDLGIVGCWSLHEDDIVEPLARQKLVRVGEHQLMENCWVGGAGHVMKRQCVADAGPLQPGQSFPQYCLRVAAKGWTNGFYFPFVMIDHLDDPRVRDLSGLSEDERKNEEAARERQFAIALEVQTATPDAGRYMGWRGKLWRKTAGLRHRRLRRLAARLEAA